MMAGMNNQQKPKTSRKPKKGFSQKHSIPKVTKNAGINFHRFRILNSLKQIVQLINYSSCYYSTKLSKATEILKTLNRIFAGKSYICKIGQARMEVASNHENKRY
jgi:hypothetical protein